MPVRGPARLASSRALTAVVLETTSIAALAIGAPSVVRNRPRTTWLRPNRLTSSVRLPRRPQCAVSFAESLAPSPFAAPRNAGSDPGPIASLAVMFRVTGPNTAVRFPAASSSSTRTLWRPCGSFEVSMSSDPSSIRSGHGCAAANSLRFGSRPSSSHGRAASPSGTGRASAPSTSTIARYRPPPVSAALRPKRMTRDQVCASVAAPVTPPTGADESSTSKRASNTYA